MDSFIFGIGIFISYFLVAIISLFVSILIFDYHRKTDENHNFSEDYEKILAISIMCLLWPMGVPLMIFHEIAYYIMVIVDRINPGGDKNEED